MSRDPKEPVDPARRDFLLGRIWRPSASKENLSLGPLPPCLESANPDEAQAHYRDLFGSDTFLSNVTISASTGGSASVGFGFHKHIKAKLKKLVNDPDTEQEFWTKSIEGAFKHDVSWHDCIESRIAALR